MVNGNTPYTLFQHTHFPKQGAHKGRWWLFMYYRLFILILLYIYTFVYLYLYPFTQDLKKKLGNTEVPESEEARYLERLVVSLTSYV